MATTQIYSKVKEKKVSQDMKALKNAIESKVDNSRMEKVPRTN